MWLIAEYESAALFSLKQSSATASGGKTLLVPTPYSFKMALLDAACRILGVRGAEVRWDEIRGLRTALRPAPKTIVTNLFQKVLKPRRAESEEGDQDFGPFQKTIGYREYAQLVGSLGIALGWAGTERREWLIDLLINISYLGKRGGFMQIIAPPIFVDELPIGFVDATSDEKMFAINGILQVLDDCTSDLTFAKANIYSGEKIKKERIIRIVVLPNYRLARSSKSFSLYERIE